LYSASNTLLDIGGNIIDFIWEGLKAGWDNVVKWFKDALDTLTGWLPDSVRGMMGFDVDVQPSVQGMEAVNSTIAHSVEAAKSVNPYNISELQPKEDPIARALRMASASACAHKGPANTRDRSRTRTPSSGKSIASDAVASDGPAWTVVTKRSPVALVGRRVPKRDCRAA